MISNLKSALFSTAILAILSACDTIADVAAVSGVAQSGNSVDGLVAEMKDGEPGQPNTDFQNMLLFSTKQTTTTVNQPFHAAFYLANTSETQKIRSSGQTVYFLVHPYLKTAQKNIGSGTIDTLNKPVLFPDSSFDCRGYYVALGPSNNYNVSFGFNWKIEIREQFSTAGGLVGSNWEITEMEPQIDIYRSKLRPFSVDSGRTRLCYLEQTKSLWGY